MASFARIDYALPGNDLVRQGLADLANHVDSVPALLVLVGGPRLRASGIAVPQMREPHPEHRLYALLARSDPDAAHSRYNALLRTLISFERAGMREPLTAVGLRRFMETLGRSATRSARVYLTGGATALLFGWRETTIHVDLKIVPEHDSLLRALPLLKEQLSINIELAAPDQFIPPLPGWEGRSPFIAEEGPLTFLHYDLYSQALAKIERGHATDVMDVKSMIGSGMVEGSRLRALFEEIIPELFRYPALDETSFRAAVEAALKENTGVD